MRVHRQIALDQLASLGCHEAVLSDQEEFVEFVLGSQLLQHLINMADNSGETALHLAQSNGLTWIADLLGDEEKIINNGPVSICFSVCDSKKIILPEYHILLSMTSICKSKQWFDHYSFLQYIGHYSEGLQTVDSVFICIN
jgi:hypothetical protein